MSQAQKHENPDLTRRLLLATLEPGEVRYYRGERLYRPYARMNRWLAK